MKFEELEQKAWSSIDRALGASLGALTVVQACLAVDGVRKIYSGFEDYFAGQEGQSATSLIVGVGFLAVSANYFDRRMSAQNPDQQ